MYDTMCWWMKWSSGRVLDSRSTGRRFNSHPRSTASNGEQVPNLLYAQANSASYPQRDVK